MLRPLLASVVCSLSLLLAACGGSGDTPAAPAAAAPPTASGSANVVKGLVRNGVVTALAWRDGAWTPVGGGRTDDNGDFLLEVTAVEAGEVLRLELGLSTDPSAPTEMLCDVASCGSGVRGDWVALDSGLGLLSWARVGSDGSLETMPMTPLSTLLVRYAESVGGGRLDAASVAVARQRVAALLGMGGGDLMARPGNIDNPLWMQVASPAAVKLSLLAAAFAELAAQNGVGVGEVVEFMAGRFLEHDGHLMQAGELGSLQDLYAGVSLLLAAPGAPAADAWVGEWLSARTASLQAGELSLPACAPDCGEFDSGAIIAALGTAEGSLGADLVRLLEERGHARLEALVAAELSHYAWLASEDSLALARAAVQLAVISAGQAFGGGPVAVEGLTMVREGNVLHFDGVLHGLSVDLDVTVPPVLEMLQAYVPGAPPVFVIGASGTLENERLRARIDGTLAIDSDGTSLTPLRNAIASLASAAVSGDAALVAAAQAALLEAIADIVRTGEATFTLQGSAGIAQLQLEGDALVETRRLAISGEGSLWVDMNGRLGGGIAASGSVTQGRIDLPNGDYVEVVPARGHFLRFALAADGSAEARFGAHVLGHGATVSGNGSIGGLGALLGNVRDQVAAALQTLSFDPAAFIAGLLEDLGTLTLAVAGEAEIPDYGHAYVLTIADGVLRLSQPNSSSVALEARLGTRGLLLSAGGQWWLFGLGLGEPGYLDLRISDSAGGEWLRSFPLPALPPLTELVAASGAGE